jgi:hypothetical protein
VSATRTCDGLKDVLQLSDEARNMLRLTALILVLTLTVFFVVIGT